MSVSTIGTKNEKKNFSSEENFIHSPSLLNDETMKKG